MGKERRDLWWALAMLLGCLAVSMGRAELTATVAPGYQFSTGERPTTSTLNRLGLPTITITGTLDGTNAGISSGSINGNMFNSSVVDNLTIDFTNSSPQALRIKSAGVGVREVSTNVAGLGLGGGGGAALSNKVDGITITITNDTLTLVTNLSPGNLLVASNSVVVGSTNSQAIAMTPLRFATNVTPGFTFTTTGTLASGSIYNGAHSLGVTPGFVRWVLVMGSTTELGYAAGDEVDLSTASQTANNPQFTYGANATNVFLNVASTAAINLGNKATGSRDLITASRWTPKCYVRP